MTPENCPPDAIFPEAHYSILRKDELEPSDVQEMKPGGMTLYMEAKVIHKSISAC